MPVQFLTDEERQRLSQFPEQIEEMVATAINKANKKTFNQLTPLLTKDRWNFLDLLLAPDTSTRKTKLTWLRKRATSKTARRLKFLKGEYIFNDGDASEYFYLVESGRVILSKDAPSGKAFTFLIATRGLPLNAVACFKPRPRFFSARAVEKTMVIAIPSSAFKQWVFENADVAACILDTMGNLLDGAYTRILDLIQEAGLIRKSRGHIEILNGLQLDGLSTSPIFIL